MSEQRRSPINFGLPLAVTIALLIFIMMPILVVLAGSFLNTAWMGMSSEQWVASSDSIVSFRWFTYVYELYQPMIAFSLKLAFFSVAICLAVGVPAGYVLATGALPGSRLIEEIVFIPLSIPGITLSIALIQAYAIVRGNWWFVLCGHLLYTLPFMVRVITSTLRSYDVMALEMAAQSLGAGFLQRFFLVVLPGLRHAAVVGSLLVFAISWGEFNVSFLLNTPIHQTYPAALYATFTFNSFQVSAAATTIFLAGILPVLIALQALGGLELGRLEQGA